MYQLPTKKISVQVLFFLCLLFSIGFVSCGDDEEEEETCTNFTSIPGEAEFNGKTLKLSIAQNIVSSGGSIFGDSYIFQFAGISSDCNELKTVRFDLTRPTGADVSGTYTIKDFFDAGDDDAYGSYGSQKINPISQTLVDLKSGTVTVDHDGNQKYTIDLEATTATNENITLKVTHQF